MSAMILFWEVFADHWNSDGFIDEFCYSENGKNKRRVF
jgi:hypothetical protein